MQSVFNKFDDARAEALAKQAGLICICETWLSDSSKNNCFQIDGYSAYFNYRSSTKKLRGGELAIYVHYDIICHRLLVKQIGKRLMYVQ